MEVHFLLHLRARIHFQHLELLKFLQTIQYTILFIGIFSNGVLKRVLLFTREKMHISVLIISQTKFCYLAFT